MRLGFALVAAALAFAAPASAQEVVNAYTAFDPTAPGSGYSNIPWLSFGYYANGTTTTVSNYDLVTSCHGGQATCVGASGIDALGVSRPNTNPDLVDGPIRFENGQLNMHPGPSGQQPLVFFTAQSAGEYRFVGAFEAHNAGTTYNVLINPVDRSALDAGFVGDRTFDFTRSFAANEQVAFLLDAFGSYSSDSTGFALSVQAVPEPASWALMIGGFGMVGMALRRRRRAARAGIAIVATA